MSQERMESDLTTGICLPFPEVSFSFPKHWPMTLSMSKPRQRRTPISRYCPESEVRIESINSSSSSPT